MATDVHTAAAGRWPEILQALAGLSPEKLSNRHQSCPVCGGRDRYRFDDKGGSGSWFCNQCGGKDHMGGGGTGIDLLMRMRRWSFRQACVEVERYLGLEAQATGRHRPQVAAAANGNGTRPSAGASALPSGLPGHGARPWRQPELPPADAPPPALDQGAIAQWCYRDAAGAQLFWIQRLCAGRSGRKAFLHRVWLDGGWHRPSRRDGFSCEWPAPRPLYGLHQLAARPAAPVLVVEGEATADAAARLFPDAVVLSWANGTNATAKSDWSPLQGRAVRLLPDADAPGRKAMARLAAMLHQQHCTVKLVDPPAELPPGWDLADADWSPQQAAERLAAWARPWPTPMGRDADGEAEAEADAEAESEPDAAQTAEASDASAGSTAAPFRCLGYDAEACYYHSCRSGQVLRLSRSSHTATHLVALAPLAYWETLYPSRMGVNWSAAASDLHERSIQAGLFCPERIRGRGAWWDGGRPLLNLGDRLVLPDGELPITAAAPTRFVYQRMPRLDGPGDVPPLTVQEAGEIVAVANRFLWEVPAYGTLMVGWVVLGPICGALRWRPHVWLTAGAGSGKSALLDRYITPLLGDFALLVSGSTTEAGLRQSIGTDAIPVVFDEAESNERQDQQRMQAILALARVVSSESGAALLKGSPSGEVSRYRVRSMFLLSSIATALKQGADQSRFAQLTLRNPADLPAAEREAHWRALDRDLERLITPELGRRLIARTVAMIPVIRQAAAVFSTAAARHFASQRLGDQYGTLMAGAWSLLSDGVPSEQEAEQCIACHDWQSVSEGREVNDELLCLQTILQRQVRVEAHDRPITRTLGELVELAAQQAHELEISAELAAQVLGRHGLRVEAGALLVSNTAKPIGRILRETAWAEGWPAMLLRLQGARRRGPVRFCGAGMVTRAVAIPLTSL